MEPTDILVLGGGSFGTALAGLLADLGKNPMMWVRREEQAREINREHTNSRYFPGLELPVGLRATTDLEGAIQGVPVVLVVVPSRSFRDVASGVGKFIKGDQVLIHATKGLEPGTYKRMSVILREETCALKIGVISGPSLAAEIMAGQPVGCVIASRYDEVIRETQALFESDRMRMYGGHDVVGTEIGGAFKNIIALAAGAVDGMGLGDNTKALLMTRGLSEMVRFGVARGAEILTFGGLAGIGDLIATCASPLSRNHRVGEGLAAGRKLDEILEEMGQVAEGVPTSAAVRQQADELGLDLPIVRAVYGVVHEGKGVAEALQELMEIPVGDELAALRY